MPCFVEDLEDLLRVVAELLLMALRMTLTKPSRRSSRLPTSASMMPADLAERLVDVGRVLAA